MFRTSLLAAIVTVGALSAASAAMVDYRATMNGKSEVPPTTSTGTGDVTATLNTDTKQLNYTLTYTGLTGPATAGRHQVPGRAFAGPSTALRTERITLP